MKRFFVTEFHHGVLPFWAACRRKEKAPPRLLSLDHHTDVVRAFRDETQRVEKDAWKWEDAVALAVSRLRHDEHFDWAVQSGTISEAFIASHTCATEPANGSLHICCDPRWPEENELFREPEKYRPLADAVLETDYLFRQFGEIEQYGPFILDIDCDYILTSRALAPQDDTYFKELVSKSLMVTLSLESDWVRLLKFPGEKITAQMTADHLCKNFQFA